MPMTAIAWYLFSFGIMVLLAGYVLSRLPQSDSSPPIDPGMTDEDIAANLRNRQRWTWSQRLVAAGYILIAASLALRLLLKIV
jgi:hypothetical protein